MAFAGGRESIENTRKLYKGIAPVYVTAVNPNKATLSKFFGYEVEDEPEYLGKITMESNGVSEEVSQLRLDFLVITNPEKTNGIVMKTKIPFFLKRAFKYNKDHTKVQVVDKYGRFAWPTVEEAKEHAIPMYSSGPANIDPDYRPAYIGEEELTDFIKKYLNIPSPSYTYTNKKTGEKTTRTIKNLNDALARLDNIESYFKGDIKELQSILKLQPTNMVKAMFGVRTTDDNKTYQAVYTQRFLLNSEINYSKIDEELQNRKAAGAYSTTEFSVAPLHEYNVESTSFTETSAAEKPFDGEGPSDTPWDWA